MDKKNNIEGSQQIDFYILANSSHDKRFNFICQLIEKAYQQQLPALVLVADDETQVKIDRLLWTFKASSFIAHEIFSNDLEAPLPPVIIAKSGEVLSQLNFNPKVVFDLSYDAITLAYPRVIIVTNQIPDVLANSRMKYKAYADIGIKPIIHNLG